MRQGECERSLERTTKALFERWLQETSQTCEEFFGVEINELCKVEELSSVSIHGYSLDETDQATCIWRSVRDFFPMYINALL